MLNVDAVFAIACIVDRREDKIGSVSKKTRVFRKGQSNSRLYSVVFCVDYYYYNVKMVFFIPRSE